jgi:hypothetical protein
LGKVEVQVNKVVRIKTGSFNDAATAKLSSSGLTDAQGAELGMYSVNNAMQLNEQFQAQPALVIPYLCPKGKPLRPHKAWPDFYRLRYLGEGGGAHTFSEATGKKPNRYSQPRDTGVCAYFPQLVNWEALRKDPTEPLLITEGELKAAKATAEGFPTIGLGGVYNFRASGQGVFFLPELEDFVWARRKVTIVYDSDYASNPMICTAINALAEELHERGAIAHVATLPNVYESDDRKTGLDDFLVERGDEELIEVLKAAEPLGITKRLWQMNNEVVYIRDPGMVVAQRTGQKMDCSKFSAHSDWATVSVPNRQMLPNGTSIVKKEAAAPTWLKWPMRRVVDKLSYLPGEERFTQKDDLLYLNQWRGWGAEPAKGSVKPFLDLVDHLFQDTEKEAKSWFLDWCAYPIQFPGTKLFSAAIVHGRMTGTGKTLIGYTLARIYGNNFIKIKSKDLYDTWWAENRQFVLGDEISGSDKRAEADMMKAMITQEEVNINIKYIPQFSIPDCVNYYLTSNHADALFLEDEDRRFFVHEVMVAPLSEEFYKAYDKWLKKDGGAGALMQWFMDRDLSHFNPKAPAFRTAARDRMIMSGKSDLDTWLTELKESPNIKLRAGQMRHQRDLFTAKEILALYEVEHERQAGKVGANGMSRALARAGFKQVNNGQPLSSIDGKQGRYFVIRNMDIWRSCKDRKKLQANLKLEPIRD